MVGAKAFGEEILISLGADEAKAAAAVYAGCVVNLLGFTVIVAWLSVCDSDVPVA